MTPYDYARRIDTKDVEGAALIIAEALAEEDRNLAFLITQEYYCLRILLPLKAAELCRNRANSHANFSAGDTRL